MAVQQALACVLLAAAVLFGGASSEVKVQRIAKRKCLPSSGNETIYDFKLKDLSGNNTIDFSDYRDKQEPGANYSEIMDSVKYVRPGKGFVPNFIMGMKLEVNGQKEHSLFSYLKRQCPTTRDGFSAQEELFYKPLKNWDIKWNWEKFLIDRSGRPYMRYDASTEPISGIIPDLKVLTRSEL